MKDLLDYAGEALGETLLSNIKHSIKVSDIPKVFHGVERPEDYTLGKWNEAFGYVLLEQYNVNVSSREELSKLLKGTSKLKNRNYSV